MHTVADGDALLSPSVTRRVLADLRSRGDRRPKDPERLGVLTAREREVLALVGRGHNNTEIGSELFMSPATAKTHVSRAMTKLHARDRAQLVVIAHETGLVEPGLTATKEHPRFPDQHPMAIAARPPPARS